MEYTSYVVHSGICTLTYIVYYITKPSSGDNLQEGAIKSSVILYITDDTVPEDDESIFVYIQSQTKGARIAQPSTDAGLKVSN